MFKHVYILNVKKKKKNLHSTLTKSYKGKVDERLVFLAGVNKQQGFNSNNIYSQEKRWRQNQTNEAQQLKLG